MLTIFGILLMGFWGLLITLLCIPQMRPIERLGLSFVLGIGLSVVLMFIALFIGIELTLMNLLFFLLFSSFLLFLFLKRQLVVFSQQFRQIVSIKNFQQNNFLEKWLIILLLGLGFYALVISLYWPVHAWDALTLYDFRGKILADPQAASAYIRGEFNWFYYGYPLLTSLSNTFVYLFGGKNPLFLSGLFYISLGVLFYGAVREFASKFISLLVTFLLLAHFQLIRHVTLDYSNLPYFTYFIIGTLYLLVWMVKEKKGYFLIGSILIGLSVLTRDQEPFWLVNFVIISLYALNRRKFIYPLIFLLLTAPQRFFWGAFKEGVAGSVFETSRQVQDSSYLINRLPDLGKLKEVFVFLYGVFSGAWGLPILLSFSVVLIFSLKELRKTKNFYLLLFIFGNLGALFLGTYISTFTLPGWEDISDSVARISVIFYPFWLYFIATSSIFQKIFPDKKIKK